MSNHERDDQLWRSRNVRVSSGLSAAEWEQVFADVRAVKAEALLNAKQALEEAFSNQLK